MDAAYTVFVEESTRLGVPLESALASVVEWRAGGTRGRSPAGGTERSQSAEEKSEAALVAQNEAALRELQRKMPGLGV